jgi:ferrous iron transport protein B
VVRTVGHKREGIDELKQTIAQAAQSPIAASRLVLGPELERALRAITAELPARLTAAERGWTATRFLVDDEALVESLRARGLRVGPALAEAAKQRAAIEANTGQDITLFVMQRYYGFIDGLLLEITVRPQRSDARALSNRIDSVLVNRALGLPIFLAVMYGIFWLTFSAGDLPMGWIEAGFEALGESVSGLWPADSESHLRSLVVDGAIAGVGGVVVFLPNILLLFLGLAILEDTGYMSRAAFIMDRFMHKFGLHGRSFIPMMSGFGCSIPGIMATRTLENERDRLTTMMVLPLMSCGARLPIWMLLIPAFFADRWRAPMLWSIYLIGVGLALALAFVLRKSVLRGDDAPFVMELAPYRLPTLRAVVGKMTERAWIYLRKAGTVILGVSILMWFITAYPKKTTYKVDQAIVAGDIQIVEDAEPGALAPGAPERITAADAANRRAAEDLRHSIAGRIGTTLEPAIEPLGFDWKVGTALIGAFAAKEVFVAQMGIVYSMGETDESSIGLRETLRRDYPPLVGFSLMLFLLIATPCMATVAVTRRESGGWKWPMLQFVGLTLVAYLLSLAVYQIGSLFT